MIAGHWIVLAALALMAGCVVYAFRPKAWREASAAVDRANARAAAKIRADDLDALARAVTAPEPILNVVRLHTGALAVTYSALTLPEALDVGTQCIQAAIATSYEHTGICDAESYANGDQA